MSRIINSFPCIVARLIFHRVALNKKLEQGFHVVAHTSICRGLVIAPEPRHTKLTEPRHMENC